MNLNELREKYNKAHSAYLQYKDTNGTNNVEAQFLPIILMYKKQIFGDKEIMFMPDCFLNYLGCDIISSDGNVYDLKVCQYCKGTEVLIDAYSKPDNHKSLDDKVNDMFIFINADNIIITNRCDIYKLVPPIEDCFYMKRDLYKTKLKAVVDTKSIRKLIIAR